MERIMVLCGLVVLCAFLSATFIVQSKWKPDGALVRKGDQ